MGSPGGVDHAGARHRGRARRQVPGRSPTRCRATCPAATAAVVAGAGHTRPPRAAGTDRWWCCCSGSTRHPTGIGRADRLDPHGFSCILEPCQSHGSSIRCSSITPRWMSSATPRCGRRPPWRARRTSASQPPGRGCDGAPDPSPMTSPTRCCGPMARTTPSPTPAGRSPRRPTQPADAAFAEQRRRLELQELPGGAGP